MNRLQVFIGWDPRERLAWQVCARSMAAHTAVPPPIAPLGMATLGAAYARPTARSAEGRLIDSISNAPMATEFALARFWLPAVAIGEWALFCDADFLWRADINDLLDEADSRYAVQVVKHKQRPVETEKMDGQVQTAYARKNWSSLMLWNLRHAGTRRLLAGDRNSKPGLWLQQFSWLRPDEIGALSPQWNVLDTGRAPEVEPLAYHFTRGTPDMLATWLPFGQEWWGHLTPAEIQRYEDAMPLRRNTGVRRQGKEQGA